jgi:hypothetical protein
LPELFEATNTTGDLKPVILPLVFRTTVTDMTRSNRVVDVERLPRSVELETTGARAEAEGG